MNLPVICIRRPVATTLLTLGLALAGAVAFFLLPVASLPQIDYPAIVVQAWLSGADPEVMATSVAAPLERRLGQIADVSEMSSSSYRGYTQIRLVFGLDRSVDGAARDVEAAINAARADLPSSLKRNPTYHKVNAAEAPILILALTSKTRSTGQLYDAAATIFQQKLSQVPGIGLVSIGGSSSPAVRVELNPHALFSYRIGLEDVRAALAAANANAPKGAIESGGRHYQLYTNDQARRAADYRSLVIASRHGAVVRLSDVADVVDSVEDIRNQGLANGEPSVLLILFRQPGANTVATVDRVKALLPRLQAALPNDIDVSLTSDRTVTIRAALHEVETTLVISGGLVMLVVFLFLRNARSALIACVAMPVSLLGTFGAMYLLGYSLDNLSLMALTVATGFVVDDAIVVLENVARHREAGLKRLEAAARGATEVSFTVLAMSVSLIAVFIPILLMGGIVGRMFREFAVTLSLAVAISLMVSLTITPMMCAARRERRPGRPSAFARRAEDAYRAVLDFYDRTLGWALAHARLTLLTLLAVLALNIYLIAVVPKGFFPHQDTGRLVGWVETDGSVSFPLMRQKLYRLLAIVQNDPAVDSVVGYAWGFIVASLKPLSERDASADEVIERLRPELARVPGAILRFQAAQDVSIGTSPGHAQYQYVLESDDRAQLERWTPRIVEALQHLPEIVDVNSDQDRDGLEARLVVDRETAARLGLSMRQIDDTLYDAFGQRPVSTIYDPLNQYQVVMELAPEYWASPRALDEIYVSAVGAPVSGTRGTNATAGTISANKAPGWSETAAAEIAGDAARNQRLNQFGNTGRQRASTAPAVSVSAEHMIPLSAFSRFRVASSALEVDHQGPFVARTISFNLAPGRSLSEAAAAIHRAVAAMAAPGALHGRFQGTARAFEQSVANEPILIAVALATVYIVLGLLYESYLHPITILSTLPSAGVGAILALIAFGSEFSVVALIGLILLIGIVQKNAIIMVDFALHAERGEALSAEEAIYRACLLRFRPILMTTLAALFGALPLALALGDGAELRRPLGICIAGGLIVSQLLTLYTTPVIYLYFDRMRSRRSVGPP
jgi:multidrug efflux pump